MIVVMEEQATDAQVTSVMAKIVELGFDIYRTTGARYTILGAVGDRPIEASDVQALEMLDGVKDVIRISGDSVKRIKRVSAIPPAPNPTIHFKHLSIFGVGLIGGSFALAARQAGIAERITGCGDKRFLQAALDLKVIDGVDESFSSDEVSDADLIYLAAPVSAIVDFLKSHGKRLKAGAIITDAGSVKREICQVAREVLPENVHFVGGHPMAGSHRVGVEFASADLFRNAPYAIIDDGNSNEATEKVIRIVEAIGSRVVKLTAEQHDQIAALISHAPQLISTALANVVAKQADATALKLAGSGFSDMTRLARSSWSIWEDIVAANRESIVSALSRVIIELQEMRDRMENGQLEKIGEAFHTANEFLREL